MKTTESLGGEARKGILNSINKSFGEKHRSGKRNGWLNAARPDS